MITINEELPTKQPLLSLEEAVCWDQYQRYINAERLPYDVIPNTSNHWEANNACPH